MEKTINEKAKYLLYIIIFLTAVSIVRAPPLWYDCDYSQDTCGLCAQQGAFDGCVGSQCFTSSGERNMIQNPSFELDLDGDGIPDEWTTTSGRVSRIEDGANLKPHGGWVQYMFQDIDISFQLIKGIKVDIDKNYTVSFAAKGICEDIIVRFLGNNLGDRELSMGAIDDRHDYVNFSKTFNISDDNIIENFRIECASGMIWLTIDAIQLEKGNVNTTFKSLPGEYSYDSDGNLQIECCGDDPFESFSSCSDTSIAWGNDAGAQDECTTAADSACCAEPSCIGPIDNLCYNLDTAYEISGLSDQDDGIALCNEFGRWEDCDLTEISCGQAVCPREGEFEVYAGELNVGEYPDIATEGCCGDDIDEYFVTRNGNISEDLNDYSCCAVSDRCVFDGGCYTAGQDYCLASINGIYNCNITTQANNWTPIILSCEAADTIINDSAWNNTIGCTDASTSCDIFEVKNIPDGGCVNGTQFPGAVTNPTIANNTVEDIDGDGFKEGCCNGNWLGANCGPGGCVSADDPGGYSNENFDYEFGCYGDGDGYCDPLYENLATAPLDCMGEMVGWTFNEPRHVSLEKDNKITGAYSLRINDSVNATQNITGLTIGENYTVMAFVKKESGATAQIRLEVDNGLGVIAVSTGNVDPATNDWTRLEVIYEVAVTDTLKVWLVRDTGEGIIYVDDVAIIKITHPVDDPIQYHNSNYTYGCCASGECWNGTNCSEPTDLSVGTELPSPVCVETDTEPVWQLPYEQDHWYRSPPLVGDGFDAYCPLENQCWEAPYEGGSELCYEKDGFSKDHLCDDWTTRTALLAANILNISEQLDGSETNHQDFTLSCDSARCFEQFSVLSPDDAKEKCSQFSLTCTYKSGDTLIAGFLLENSVPDLSETCQTGPPFLNFSWETNLPDSNPKCYFYEILDIVNGFDDDLGGDNLKMKINYGDGFRNAELTQDGLGFGPGNNQHVIQSIGFNNITKIVIFSNKVLDYESLLVGEGTDLSPLDEQFPRLKRYINGEIVLPANTGTLPLLLSWTRDFDAILIDKKDNITIEALIESKNDPANYFTILYENVSNGNICQDLEDRYLSPLSGRTGFGAKFNCTSFSNNIDAFVVCGTDEIICDEAKIYDNSPSDNPVDPYFEFDVWHDLTSRFRNFSNCITDRNFDMSAVPGFYSGDINKSEDFVVYNNRNTEGCCPVNQCWNGKGCTAEFDLFEYNDYFEDPKFMCIEGIWEDAYLRNDWNRVEQDYCAFANQCYLPKSVYLEADYVDFKASNLDYRNCTSVDIDHFYYNDNYCLTGNWTTRTALIAAEFLDFVVDSGFTDFTLFCDNYEKALNVLDFSVEGGVVYSSYLGAGATNNFCVLRYFDSGTDNRYEVAFGTSLNDDTNISQFLTSIFGAAGDECDSISGEQFGDCLGDNILWWNNATKLVIYNKDGMALTSTILQDLWDFLLDPIRTVIVWVQSLFAPDIDVSPPEDFDRYFALVKATKVARGVVTNNTLTDRFVVVTYEDFVTDISQPMLRRSTDINVSGSYNVSSTFFDLLFRDWIALTAKIRVQ